MNVVLQGINKMKDSLKNSLQEQWLVEQQKREQISALAHDVKTPLTIVKGNVELLKETHMTDQPHFILKGGFLIAGIVMVPNY